ncbi:MAG: pyridoxal phosphate-dependent aminotransferase [Bacteroidota bacterium]
MPSISLRGKNVPLSPFRKLIPFADEAKARGTQVYHLNIGQPDILTPQHAVAALQATEIDILAYSPAIGIETYREGLKEYYQTFNIEVATEDIIVTTGASEALQFLMYACFNQSDEIIVPEPFYANYNGFAQIADVQIRPITCTLETGFALPSTADFERVITPKTKAIFITNPNNPTGCFYDEKVLRQLGALAKEYNLYLIADEVYREFCYDGNRFFSVLNLAGMEDHVAVVDSVSKRYSACGARVGAIVTRNEALKEAITKYAKLRLSPPGLGQILAEAMLNNTEDYLQEVYQEYDRRRKVVYRRLQNMKEVVSYLPGGAFYCFAQFPVESSEHFCRWLLTDFEHEGSTVMLSPGSGFYATAGLGAQEARIAYVLNPEKLEKAMDCLEKALEVYPYKVRSKNLEVSFLEKTNN